MSFAKSLYEYIPVNPDEELAFQPDMDMIIFEKDDLDWWLVKASDGQVGLVPSNYLEEVRTRTWEGWKAKPLISSFPCLPTLFES